MCFLIGDQKMSATSVKNDFMIPTIAGSGELASYLPEDRTGGSRARSLSRMLSLAGWRTQALESFVFLAVIAAIRPHVAGDAVLPGLPHPFWIPVLLASCQYGTTGGVIATVAASLFYFFDLSPPSAVQDFYAYSKELATQPALWLGTALVIGGLRNLQIHQYAELADQFEASRRHRGDLSEGLHRAVVEIAALEQRIAFDVGTVAALSRSLALIDISDRRAAAVSFGEVFRVAAGVGTFTIYLKCGGAYQAALAIENDSPNSNKSAAPLSLSAIEAVTSHARGHGEAGRTAWDDRLGVVRVPSFNADAEPLVVIVCDLKACRDRRQFDRRAEELGRLLATIMRACPEKLPEAES